MEECDLIRKEMSNLSCLADVLEYSAIVASDTKSVIKCQLMKDLRVSSNEYVTVHN